MSDQSEIRDLIEGWAIWRDTADWERLRSAYHEGGQMMTTWFEGSAAEFVDRSIQAFARGSMSHHVLGGIFIEVAGTRAVAQTRMVLHARAVLDGVECDAACTGRFVDLLEKRDGRWGIVLRQPVYEKDRLDPVDPSARLELDRSVLDRFPIGYRHLAYLQTKTGQSVGLGLPGLRGPEIERLQAKGREWLKG